MGTCSYELDHFCNTGGGFGVGNGAGRGTFEKNFEFFLVSSESFAIPLLQKKPLKRDKAKISNSF